MWRQPSPAHRPSQAKLVEPFGIVICDAPREHVPFPGVRWNFESLKLSQHIQSCTLAFDMGFWGNMLPAQQPAHELRGGDRLNLFSKRSDRKAVNTCEQSALAPFRYLFVWERAARPRVFSGKFASKYGSAGFHAKQGLFNFCGRNSQ